MARRSVPLLLVVLAACGDSLGLPPPSFPNVVDTTILFALRGTSIASPSAYDIVAQSVARTELGEPFDFAFDIDSTGVPLIFPSSVLGLTSQAGLQVFTVPFDSVITAPTEGFVADSAIRVEEQTVFVARSRSSTQFCTFLGPLPRYGKFRVLVVDFAERSITLETLVNANCGFRGLEPGLPPS